MTSCKNCSEKFEGKYCSNCGIKGEHKRINRHYIVHEIEHGVFHVDGGILYTIKELAIRPGKSVINFVEGEKERFKHFSPFGFLIVTSLLYGFISHLAGYEEPGVADDANSAIINWIEKNNNYANLIAILFLSLGLKYIFYSKRGYNIFEYLVLMAFVTGQIMVLGVFAEALSGLVKSEIVTDIYLMVSFIYCSWAIGGFFKSKNFWGYLKAFAAYSCCIIFFIIIVMIADELLAAK